jgi:hypothetical protein
MVPVLVYVLVEVCKFDPIRSDSFVFRNKNIHFGLDRIDKLGSVEIEWIYIHDNYCRCIIRLTCISCFYIYLVKYFHLNEKFILLQDSSEFFIKTRIRIKG